MKVYIIYVIQKLIKNKFMVPNKLTVNFDHQSFEEYKTRNKYFKNPVFYTIFLSKMCKDYA